MISVNSHIFFFTFFSEKLILIDAIFVVSYYTILIDFFLKKWTYNLSYSLFALEKLEIGLSLVSAVNLFLNTKLKFFVS